jgi:hypothetical protein
VWIRQGRNVFYIRGGDGRALQEEARRAGTTFLEVPDTDGANVLKVHGGASSEELQALREAAGRLPKGHAMRARDIYLSERLGGTPHGAVVEGIAVDDGTILDRRVLMTARGKEVFYHEVGHKMDEAVVWSPRGPLSARYSSSAPWGQGSFVSAYARVNGAEDFAETYAYVVKHQGNPLKLLHPDAFWKKMAMVRACQVPIVDARAAAVAGGSMAGIAAWTYANCSR